MTIYKQKGNGYCLVTSLAILLQEHPDKLIKEIGVEGNEVIFQHTVGKTGLRGYHIQELIDCCLRRGKVLVPIDPRPSLRQDETSLEIHYIHSEEFDYARFEYHLRYANGIVIGQNARGDDHACAIINGKIYDPATGDFAVGFRILELWLLYVIKS